MKLFRYIVPIFFFFLSLGAVAQMDKDGNFHWDELYTPDEILELDMSLPNKVDVSAIKNRERVKYVKLKCYPWIEHIPFTPEDFPNIEALRIESFLIQGLNGIDGFKKIKRLEVTDIEGRGPARALLRTNLPCVSNPIWKMTWLEELRIKGIDILVTENSISKLRSVKYLNIDIFNEFYGCSFFDEFEKLASLKQIYFGKEGANLTLYLAKTFSEKGIDVVGTFDVDKISSTIVTKDEDSYPNDIEWNEIIRYRPWGANYNRNKPIYVYDNTEDDITMYVKRQDGKVCFIKSQWKEESGWRNITYYNFNYLTNKEDIKKSLPDIEQLEKNREERRNKNEEDVWYNYYNFSKLVQNDAPQIEILRFVPSFEKRQEYGLYVLADTMTYRYEYEVPTESYYDYNHPENGILSFYSPIGHKSLKLSTGYVIFAEFDYKTNMLWELGCSDCGGFIIHNNELGFGDDKIEKFAVGCCCCGDSRVCLRDDFEYFKNMKRCNSSEDKMNLRFLYNNVDTFRTNYKRELGSFAKYLEDRVPNGLLNFLDLQ